MLSWPAGRPCDRAPWGARRIAFVPAADRQSAAPGSECASWLPTASTAARRRRPERCRSQPPPQTRPARRPAEGQRLTECGHSTNDTWNANRRIQEAVTGQARSFRRAMTALAARGDSNPSPACDGEPGAAVRVGLAAVLSLTPRSRPTPCRRKTSVRGRDHGNSDFTERTGAVLRVGTLAGVGWGGGGVLV